MAHASLALTAAGPGIAPEEVRTESDCDMSMTSIPQVRFRTVGGVRIRYADSGSPQKPAVVLTSPWPESVYAFAPMWASLYQHPVEQVDLAQLFAALDADPNIRAIVLTGSGRNFSYGLDLPAMGGFLAQLIAEADLGRAHLVAPDAGTSAAQFAAAAHPERLASVGVGTGGAAVPIQLGEPLASCVLDPDLDKYRRIDPHVIVNTAVDTLAGGIPDDIRADYLAAMRATASSSRCATPAGIPTNCPYWPGCCRRSRSRSRSSPAAATASSRSPTRSSSTSGCLPAAW